MAAFITLTEIRHWLDVKGTADDALLEDLIVAASKFIETWISRDLSSRSYTETYDGPGGRRLSLRAYPVTAVTSLTIDGATIPAAASSTDLGYVISGRGLALRGYRFTEGVENVAVTYVAGYDSVPVDVAQACKELVGLRYKERDRIGYVSKAVGGEVVAYSQKDMSEAVKTLLNAYREVRPI